MRERNELITHLIRIYSLHKLDYISLFLGTIDFMDQVTQEVPDGMVWCVVRMQILVFSMKLLMPQIHKPLTLVGHRPDSSHKLWLRRRFLYNFLKSTKNTSDPMFAAESC